MPLQMQHDHLGGDPGVTLPPARDPSGGFTAIASRYTRAVFSSSLSTLALFWVCPILDFMRKKQEVQTVAPGE